MQAEEELAELSPAKDMLLSIGVFDGVHLGHKYLISQLMERAKQQDLLSGVVTFRQHPQELLSPQTRLPLLTDVNTRARLLKDEGVDAIITLSFTHDLAQLTARQFVSLLKKHLRMRGLVIGPDFALGRDREGSADTLCKIGHNMDFSVTVVPYVKLNGEVVSSTAIRNALVEGNMKRVARLIGRFFSLQGIVTIGAGRGEELGFPTANLKVEPRQAIPADGVYATWTYIDGKAYQSMTNIGVSPTFGHNERAIEIYIVDYDGNLYGHEIKLDIVERLRDEKRFDTVDDLKKQIAEDVKQGITLLNSQGKK
jgi:riboflavin kinase/FMN adenylyltransferase